MTEMLRIMRYYVNKQSTQLSTVNVIQRNMLHSMTDTVELHKI